MAETSTPMITRYASIFLSKLFAMKNIIPFLVRHPGREAGAGLPDGGVGPDAGGLVEVLVRGQGRARGRDAPQGLVV